MLYIFKARYSFANCQGCCVARVVWITSHKGFFVCVGLVVAFFFFLSTESNESFSQINFALYVSPAWQGIFKERGKHSAYENVSIRRQQDEVSITNCSLRGEKWVANVGSFIKDTFWFDFFFQLRDPDSFVNNETSVSVFFLVLRIFSFLILTKSAVFWGGCWVKDSMFGSFLSSCKQNLFFELLVTLGPKSLKSPQKPVDGFSFVDKPPVFC